MIFQSKAKPEDKSNSATQPTQSTATRKPQPSAAKPTRHSIIPKGMEITGDLASTGDINVEGTIQGNISCRTLTLEGEPLITGSVKAETIRVCGSFNGNMQAKKVALTKTAKVTGEIHYHTLEIEAGASYEGTLHRLNEMSGKPSSRPATVGV